MGDELDVAQSKSSLAILQQLTEEIPSGVSSEDVGRILKLIAQSPEETTKYIASQITIPLKAALESFWEEFQLEEKLQCLQLKQHRYDVNTIKLKYLQRKKQHLEEILMKTNNELNDAYNSLQKNVEEIKQMDEKMQRDL